MSFFGFDPSANPGSRPGFSQPADPFAGLSGGIGGEEEEEIDFEDAYDEFNDDTFGGASLEPEGKSKPVGTDFDFSGRTAQVSNAIQEEQAVYQRRQPIVKPSARPEPKKATRSGYEKYQNPGAIDDLQVDPTLWGQAAPPTAAAQPAVSHVPAPAQQQEAPPRMPTLDEVEAQMAQSGGAQLQQQQQQLPPQQQYQPAQFNNQGVPQQYHQQQQHQQQIDPRYYQQRPHPDSSQPQHFQQTHGYHTHQGSMSAGRGGMPQMGGNMGGAHIVTHPQQIMQMSHEDRAAALAEDAKRAKRNHKIWLLSKDNGLMTPQDKNFITRIQLQQLMAATGGTDDRDADAALAEDFYYQVISSIRGGPRQDPSQPLSHFAQTYLFQTGGRTGGHRKNGRADNHMQRMEQQVQRAVEAAKLKPKSKQLVLEGSLGKISFSNAKTPKPLLNLKRQESSDLSRRPGSSSKQLGGDRLTGSDRKSILNNIETVYRTLMNLEDEARKEPFLPPDAEPTDDFREAHDEWSGAMHRLSSRLWDELKVLEAINMGSNVPHPFIAFLSYAKGKKAIPRIFRYLSSEQRVTMLTMIVIHLDILDVIRCGALAPGETTLPADARESIELFSQTVTPSLFYYVSEESLFTIIGLLGLILDRVNVTHVAGTRVGMSILTMLTSRATLIKEAGEAGDQDWAQWLDYYNKLFDLLEPILAGVFPPSLNVDDVYVWQFLAAIGSGATPEQQQRLVIAVKDRVMATIRQAKTLPPDMAGQKRANVNLFMRAIGLDVDLLE